ncbi:MAG: phenylglyoxylate dehydrogenase [Deltaproteobacteria bacterium]|nr:phenylglyoxylate dehydrogenase [Deltaproteobacteria bacterium]
MTTEDKGTVKVLKGNIAAAHAVLLCKPDVVAAYPITPQSSLVEELSKFYADGLLEAEYVEAEGEHSVMSILIGASSAGGRVFSATSSNGLAFMLEPYFYASTLRLPIVMVNVCRELAAPNTVLCSQQDMLTMRDCGWIQIHAESCQEILDSIIMAYKLAEDPDILVPVNVCYDGHYLSHMSARVEIPDQADVDSFLPSRELPDCRLDPAKPMMQGVFLSGKLFTEFRHKHCMAMSNAKQKIDDIDKEFHKAFGRGYGGLIEEYRTEDAETVLLAMGSAASTAKVMIDKKREEGVKVGLVRIRTFRPFPLERLTRAVQGKKALGVIDRDVCFGWNTGIIFMEIRAALNKSGLSIPMVNFIDGLSGADITLEHIEKAIDVTSHAAKGEPFQEVNWLMILE